MVGWPIHTGWREENLSLLRYVREEAVAKIHPFSSFGRNMLKLTKQELNLWIHAVVLCNYCVILGYGGYKEGFLSATRMPHFVMSLWMLQHVQCFQKKHEKAPFLTCCRTADLNYQAWSGRLERNPLIGIYIYIFFFLRNFLAAEWMHHDSWRIRYLFRQLKLLN